MIAVSSPPLSREEVAEVIRAADRVLGFIDETLHAASDSRVGGQIIARVLEHMGANLAFGAADRLTPEQIAHMKEQIVFALSAGWDRGLGLGSPTVNQTRRP